MGAKLEIVRFRTQGVITGSAPQRVATHSPWESKMLTDSEAQPRAGVGVKVPMTVRVPVGVWVTVAVGVSVAE